MNTVYAVARKFTKVNDDAQQWLTRLNSYKFFYNTNLFAFYFIHPNKKKMYKNSRVAEFGQRIPLNGINKYLLKDCW